eukprot:SAG31_NODE_44710_length_261_cov_1.592593_1_plen_42_part_10
MTLADGRPKGALHTSVTSRRRIRTVNLPSYCCTTNRSLPLCH